MTPVARPRVVIVAGGFGGLAAANALRRAAVHITLVDRQNHHCFQPLLYQVATAALSPADNAWPIRSILSAQDNVRVVMGGVIIADREARLVRTAGGQCYPFDYLVIATGATHSYFGRDEWHGRNSRAPQRHSNTGTMVTSRLLVVNPQSSPLGRFA